MPTKPPRQWGVIGLWTTVGLATVLIIGYAAFASWRGARPWNDRLTGLAGVTDYASTNPAWLTSAHKSGPLTYEVTPSVGGSHNSSWQNCAGDVYDAPIAAEHATHSLEHGAVWVTYRPDLPADQVARLAEHVRGVDFMFMSPHDNLDAAISLQAWGYRLTVDDAADEQIRDFIGAARMKAGPEQGAPCPGGITATGTTPRDLNPQGS
ncbi:DUF3105 domain-containing protein [Asanoa iriomotensis]|uniref:DUF3105 domain-containing protein n=1 Tax=Asanoa iriomotensis TaxID=234613 RepID=UPI001EF2484E|nr:DUF3105 domain-containing protein [Asanoa iriomotensis]